MTFQTHAVFEGTECLQLKSGLLVYGDDRGTCFVSLHGVAPCTDKSKPPRLGPGSPISRALIVSLFNGLEFKVQERSILPEQCLYWNSDMMLWWKPAGRRRIFFNAKNDILNALSGEEVMHPPLLFRAQESGLSVWALPGSVRPTEATVLCRAPYFNVYRDGRMCTGNVRLPDQIQTNQIDMWEEGFFGSNFAHGNTQELTSHPGGHTGYWSMLAKEKSTKASAIKYLQPLSLTVAEIIKGKPTNGYAE